MRLALLDEGNATINALILSAARQARAQLLILELGELAGFARAGALVQPRRRPILRVFVNHVLGHIHDFQLLAVAIFQLVSLLQGPLGYLTQRVRHLRESTVQHALLGAHLVDGALHMPCASINRPSCLLG